MWWLVAAGVVALLLVGYLLFLRMLGRRVVAVSRPRKVLEVHTEAGAVVLPRSELTEAPGEYGLWFGSEYRDHAVVGEILTRDDTTVSRRVLSPAGVLPEQPFTAQWTGHTLSSPGDLGLPWSEVAVPLHGGGSAPAWFFPPASTSAPWAVHVQGIRTSRLVTLRAVEAAQRAGLASLVVTYRGAGDGAPQSASNLGLWEWKDLRDAVAFARAEGAPSVVVIAWSMGAGLALELARREPHQVDSLVLICPATNWREIVRHGAKQAHLPRFVADSALVLLETPVLSRIVGLKHPINFDALDWSRPGSVTVPTLVIHSPGDQEIPFALSAAFADAHPGVVTLVETAEAPHGWEPNVDPQGFGAAIGSWLTRIQN